MYIQFKKAETLQRKLQRSFKRTNRKKYTIEVYMQNMKSLNKNNVMHYLNNTKVV